jgi:FkbM family methyltransferase
MLVNQFDQQGQTLLNAGHVAEEDVEFCYKYIAAKGTNPTVFDIGAGFGTFSSWLAHVFPAAPIYCFEPQRAVCQLLSANAAINNFHNVYTYNLALGSENTWLEYQEPDYFQPADFGSFTLDCPHAIACTDKSVAVEVKTLDSFVDTHKIGAVDALKITTNSMDVAVLRGASEILKRFHPVIFMDYTAGNDGNRNDIVDILESNDYNFKGTINKILAVYGTLE